MLISRYLKIAVFTGLFLLSESCIEGVKVPLRVVDAKLVIEGFISNDKPPYSVRISNTGVFNSASYEPTYLTVSGAIVIIKDNQGNQTRLIQDLYDPFTYKTTDTTFVGTVGRTYSISVSTPEGKTYVSTPEKLLNPVPISSIYREYVKVFDYSGQTYTNPDGYILVTPPQPDRFNIYIDTKDPADQTNFYRWAGFGYSRVESSGVTCPYRSTNNCYVSCWQPHSSLGINIMSDAQINGQTIRKNNVYFSPIYAIGQHLMEISQYSISREAYQYYELFNQQSKRTGSILDPLPAPIVGNISAQNNPNDLALGYFSAQSVTKIRYSFLDNSITQTFINSRYNGYFIQKGDCRVVYAGGLEFLPENW